MKSEKEFYSVYGKYYPKGTYICNECGYPHPDNISIQIYTYPGHIRGDYCNDCANMLTMYYLYGN